MAHSQAMEFLPKNAGGKTVKADLSGVQNV